MTIRDALDFTKGMSLKERRELATTQFGLNAGVGVAVGI